MTKTSLALWAAFCLSMCQCFAQAPVISFQNQNIAGLSAPVDLVNAADGSNRMFIVQRTGLIKLWNGGTTTSNFINLGPSGDNIITSAGSEQGLLSLVFHPNYDGVNNRYFYVYYTDLSGNIAIRRYQTMVGNPDLGDINSDLLLLTIPHPGNTNHNGGKLNFGTDGYLYFATGDGGGAGDVPNNAQNGNSLLGKMLRIDVDNTSAFGNYAAPPSNPYVSNPSVDDRIYALGLRNPFRWSFDRLNGNIWIGDVGQGAWEEIDFRTASDAATGTNYGWRCYEGAHAYNTSGCLPISSYISPVFEYPNPGTGAAVTGGYVYRGNEYPNFRGYYTAADVYSGTVYLVWPNGSGWSASSQAGLGNIVGFGEAENGTLYAVSLSGAVYKVVANGGTPLPLQLVSFTALHHDHFNELQWSTHSEKDLKQFSIEYSIDGRNFQVLSSIAATGSETGSNYSYRHFYEPGPVIYYRLKMEEEGGKYQYSGILKLSGFKKATVYPTMIENGQISINSSESMQTIQLIHSSGALVFEKKMNGWRGGVTLRLPATAPGVYIVHLVTDVGTVSRKILIR